jgi:hypothetical protein
LVEFVAYIMFAGGDRAFLGSWVNGIGFYVATVGMALPWIFAAFQMSFTTVGGGLGGNVTSELFNYSVFLMIMGLTMWLATSSMHYLLQGRLLCHIAALDARDAVVVNPDIVHVDVVTTVIDAEVVDEVHQDATDTAN